MPCIYDVVPDYVERRAAFSDEHLSLGWEAHARGELVLGGALAGSGGRRRPALFRRLAGRRGGLCRSRPLRPQRPRHPLARPPMEDGVGDGAAARDAAGNRSIADG